MGLFGNLRMYHFSCDFTFLVYNPFLLYLKSFIVYCSFLAPPWLKITQFPKLNPDRLVSLEKERKLSLQYGIETFSKKRLGRDPYGKNWNQSFLAVQHSRFPFLENCIAMFVKYADVLRLYSCFEIQRVGHVLSPHFVCTHIYLVTGLPSRQPLCPLPDRHNVCEACKFSE